MMRKLTWDVTIAALVFWVLMALFRGGGLTLVAFENTFFQMLIFAMIYAAIRVVLLVLRKGDLTNLSADACEGCDAVIFAAGSGGSTGPEMTDKVDRDGAKDLVDIAAKAGISRFVMLSSVGADNPDPDSELAHYLQAKHEADVHLQNSGLEYAILRPVALTDDAGNRNMIFGDSVDVKAKAARGDVAAALVDAVTDPEWKNQALLMQSA